LSFGLGACGTSIQRSEWRRTVGLLCSCGIIAHERNLQFDLVTALGPSNSGPTLPVSEVIFTHPAAQFGDVDD
jgi:hypothetical protein